MDRQFRVLVRLRYRNDGITEDMVARDVEESLDENGVHWLPVIEAVEVG